MREELSEKWLNAVSSVRAPRPVDCSHAKRRDQNADIGLMDGDGVRFCFLKNFYYYFLCLWTFDALGEAVCVLVM